jgi:hypothetical protein
MKFAAVLGLCLLLALFGIGSVFDASLSLLITGALVIVAGCATFGRSLERSASSPRRRLP